jgi:integrase
MLALHAGLRDAEIRGLQWSRVSLEKTVLTVGESKTEAGEGRTIPLNADALAALVEHSKWFLKRFGPMRSLRLPIRQTPAHRPDEACDHVQNGLGQGQEGRRGNRALAR